MSAGKKNTRVLRKVKLEILNSIRCTRDRIKLLMEYQNMIGNPNEIFDLRVVKSVATKRGSVN